MPLRPHDEPPRTREGDRGGVNPASDRHIRPSTQSAYELGPLCTSLG